MQRWDGGLLGERQAAAVEEWLGTPALLADFSWGQTDTKVLHGAGRESAVIVKAGGAANHHIRREIAAHAAYTGPLVDAGRAGRMLFSDRTLNVLVLEYLSGELVEGSAWELAADVHFQAGQVLKLLHDQEGRADAEYEARATSKALAWLEREHRINPEVGREVRGRLNSYRPLPVAAVPTHGDWQPRNWLYDAGVVKVIDFGRFEFRPAASDFCRLSVQQWVKKPSLETAFLRGYGGDPRDARVWRMDLLREAVGTAVWAYLVGDEAFEAQGHWMLERALGRF